MNSLVHRHNRITRITHWVNTVGLLILFMSGLQIFNAYPHLHWGSKAEPDEAFFSIYAANEGGVIRGYTQFYGWRVETTGFLGLQNTEMGPLPRGFPSWLTIPGYFWLAGGRRWHFFFAWLFVLNGLLYFLYNLLNGHLRKFLLTPRDVAKFLPMMIYYLRLRRESPQEGEYNPLQKMAYTGVFFILTPVIILSGLAMSPQMDVAFNWLPAIFGGRQSARSFHFILTFLFTLFTFGHIFMVVTTGLFNNMRSMVTGWYRAKIPGSPVVATETAATSPSPRRTLTPTLSLEGEGEGEGGNEEDRPRSDIAFEADSQADRKEDGGGNEKKES
jgi:Ni/Fe-hydrogenase b-type cytochrome subunit